MNGALMGSFLLKHNFKCKRIIKKDKIYRKEEK